MGQPFPIRESSILSLAELASRWLGLLFLAELVRRLGLEQSAAFRMTLPLVGIAAAFGSIGLPQALTRLFAFSACREKAQVAKADLITAAFGTLCAAGLTWAMLAVMASVAAQEPINRQELARLLQASTPLLVLMCVTGSLRGMLFGLGSTYAPAVAQVLEVGTRLVVLLFFIPDGREGALFGIWTLTAGEAAAGVFLGLRFWRSLQKRGLAHRAPASEKGLDLFSVLRMSFAPTGQSLLASLGYALELPLAQEWLSHRYGTSIAMQWIAEYAAVALPLLCAPMVFTDGVATALLPVAAAARAAHGESFAFYLRRVIGVVALIALPVTGSLLVLAPALTKWVGTASAAPLLLLLVPLAFPLYLQAPLSSLLQAQGRSRALLAAGLCGDAARIGGLWMAVSMWGLGRAGLAFAFACAVLVQTAVLLRMAARLSPLTVPWRTLTAAGQTALAVAALLLVGLHAPVAVSFSEHPWVWCAVATTLAVFSLLLAREVTPQGLSRLPMVGRSLGRASRVLLRSFRDAEK